MSRGPAVGVDFLDMVLAAHAGDAAWLRQFFNEVVADNVKLEALAQSTERSARAWQERALRLAEIAEAAIRSLDSIHAGRCDSKQDRPYDRYWAVREYAGSRHRAGLNELKSLTE